MVVVEAFGQVQREAAFQAKLDEQAAKLRAAAFEARLQTVKAKSFGRV